MTLQVKVLGWKATGLRCVDHEFNFRTSGNKTHQISLIQMPNGNGKTTTLQLLKAALSGEMPTDWQELAKQGSKYGHFELLLLLNDKKVTVQIEMDFEQGRYQFSTTRGAGKVSGFDPPIEFRHFLNKDFVSFFVFDGELAQHLLSQQYSDADQVIDHLFQIDLLKVVRGRVLKYWDDYRSGVKADDQSAVTRRTNKFLFLVERLKNCEFDYQNLLDRKRKLERSIKRMSDEFDKQIEQGKKNQNELVKTAEKLADRVKQCHEVAIATLNQLSDPCAISDVASALIKEFKGGLDRVKLPESAAREFFEELADEQCCICGREIDEAVANAIKERAKQYLGSDDVSLLNAIKTSIESSASSAPTLAKELWSNVHRLDAYEKEKTAIQNVYDHLLTLAKQDPAVKKKSDELDKLKKELLGVANDLEKYDDDDDSLPDQQLFCIRLLKARKDKAENELAEITQTVQVKERRDILVKILEKAWSSASTTMKQELKTEANERIHTLLPNNKIQIDDIQGALRLKGKKSGSVGETLSVAYAFLSCLYTRAQHRLPFIVDSPAGPLDLKVRSEISGIIPKLSDQFIAFVISSELQNFTKPLAASCKDIQYLTVFRKGIKKYDDSAKSQVGSIESEDGMIVSSQSFFDKFQLEEQ